jgi:hypothetical protein
MNKKLQYISITTFVAVLALGITGVALASSPTVTMDPIGTLMYPIFPQNYDVTGTVSHTPNLNPVSSVTLTIDGLFESSEVIPNGSGSTFNYTLPWSILSAGTYNVMVTASHGSADGIAEEIVEVIYDGPVVVNVCPAAPSIAAHYLKDLGIRSGSKTFKNIVSLVADHMGPQTDFDGVMSCDEGYADVVMTFVDAHMNVSK